MLNAKLKIILIVFGVLIGLYFVQYMVTSVNAVSSKRELFENDVDETPNSRPEVNKKKKPTEVTDKDVKLSILEHVEEAFSEMYPKSDQKPIIFELLTRKEEFDNIKEKFTEEGSSAVGTYIRNFVKKNIKELETTKIDNKEEFDDEEKEMNKPLDGVIEKMEQNVNASMIASELDTIMGRIKELRQEVEKMKETTAKKPAAAVKETFVDPPPSKKSSLKLEPGVEGFENRLHYASY